MSRARLQLAPSSLPLPLTWEKLAGFGSSLPKEGGGRGCSAGAGPAGSPYSPLSSEEERDPPVPPLQLPGAQPMGSIRAVVGIYFSAGARQGTRINNPWVLKGAARWFYCTVKLILTSRPYVYTRIYVHMFSVRASKQCPPPSPNSGHVAGPKSRDVIVWRDMLWRRTETRLRGTLHTPPRPALVKRSMICICHRFNMS